MTLQPKCEDVETAEGVAITVTGVAQVNHLTSPNLSSKCLFQVCQTGFRAKTPLSSFPFIPLLPFLVPDFVPPPGMNSANLSQSLIRLKVTDLCLTW